MRGGVHERRRKRGRQRMGARKKRRKKGTPKGEGA